MTDLTDEQLIERFKATDEMQWFEALVSRHIGRVRATVYPMVLNDADAAEVTQDVFVRVIKGLPRFKSRARFSSWLYRITMNTTYSFLRRRGANPVSLRDEVPEQVDTVNPFEHMAAGEMDGRIEQALARLSPRLRAAITLTAIEGMTPKEAARAQGCVTATMYWRVHEARRILKEDLKI